MTSIKASDPSTAAKGEGVREIEHARQQLGFQANQPGPNNQETAPAGIGNSKRIAEHRSGGHVVINAISIGDRHRRDLGDIAGLAQNISARGLLHPIVINHDGRLIARGTPAGCREGSWLDHGSCDGDRSRADRAW